MTDAVQAALIASVPATLAALGTLIQSIKNSKKLEIIHNGISDKILKNAHSAGMSQQRADDKSDSEGTPRQPIP